MLDTLIPSKAHIKKPMDNQVREADSNPKSVYGFGHLDFCRRCLGVLKDREDELVSRREGRKTVEIIVAAYRPALSDWWVRMCAMPQ